MLLSFSQIFRVKHVTAQLTNLNQFLLYCFGLKLGFFCEMLDFYTPFNLITKGTATRKVETLHSNTVSRKCSMKTLQSVQLAVMLTICLQGTYHKSGLSKLSYGGLSCSLHLQFYNGTFLQSIYLMFCIYNTQSVLFSYHH